MKEQHQVDPPEPSPTAPQPLMPGSQIPEIVEKLKEKNEQIEKATPIPLAKAAIQERRQLLKIYAIDAFVGIVAFVVFVSAAVISTLIAGGVGKFGILIKIVAWSISALGALCGIGLATRNASDFIQLLIQKGPSKQASGQKVTDEGRTT